MRLVPKKTIKERINIKPSDVNLQPQILKVGIIQIPMKSQSKIVSANQFKVRVIIKKYFNEILPPIYNPIKSAVIAALEKCNFPIQFEIDDKLIEKRIFTQSQVEAIQGLVSKHNSKF